MHVHEGHGPPRVLLGNLEPVVKLGMTAVLEEDGIEVIGEESRPAALVLMAGRLRPDAVVLDLEHTTSRELSERVRAASPETTVVFWTRDEDVMEVMVRYRTVGDMTCTAAVESTATNYAAVIAEVAASRITERGATRADDRFSEAAMEDRKKEGYF